MSKSKIQPYDTVSLKDATELIAVDTDNTYMVRGETGIGKSAILKSLGKKPQFKNHMLCYVDMTTQDLGDVMMPTILEENGMKICKFVPNSALGYQYKEPVIIMLDEFGKANKAVKNAYLPLLQEHRTGENHLKDGSLVFATTNLSIEGLGDVLETHQRNRLNIITARKPSAEEWTIWAVDNNVHPIILAAAEQFPQMLGSFTEYPEPKDNKYIYHPKELRESFCTPRSLEKASHMMHAIEGKGIGHATIGHALAGTIGPAAAYDVMALLQMNEKLPTIKEILASPTKASLPDSPAALILLIYTAVQSIEKETIDPWMKYIQRMKTEAQALFATTVLRTGKGSTVGSSKAFIEYATRNGWAFGS